MWKMHTLHTAPYNANALVIILKAPPTPLLHPDPPTQVQQGSDLPVL